MIVTIQRKQHHKGYCKSEPLPITMENVKQCRKYSYFFTRFNIALPHGPAVPFLSIHSVSNGFVPTLFGSCYTKFSYYHWEVGLLLKREQRRGRSEGEEGEETERCRGKRN